MPDQDNKEIPQEQPPKRSLKDIFAGPPAESKITEPDLSFSTGSIIEPHSNPDKQEVLFGESAKRLAKEELEISELAAKYARGSWALKLEGEKDFYIFGYEGGSAVNFRTPEIRRDEKKYGSEETHINFSYFDGVPRDFNGSGDVGVMTNGRLDVSVYTDLETMEDFNKYVAEKGPNTFTSTYSIYYFNQEGAYGKQMMVESDFPTSNPILKDTGLLKFFKSKMYAEDFELAGKALSLIKGKLQAALGITPDKADDPPKPKGV